MENKEQLRSHLFIIRLWLEELGEGQAEWRGRVRNIATGEITYFRDWQGLAANMQKMMSANRDAKDERLPETE